MGMFAGSRRSPITLARAATLSLLLALVLSAAAAAGAAASLSLLSTNAEAVKADRGVGAIFWPSDDGDVVAFVSSSGNLVPEAPFAGLYQAYVKQVSTGVVTLVSATAAGVADGNTDMVAVSRNGRYAAFVSRGSNLHAADTDTEPDLYVKDLETGVLRLASTNSAGVKGNQSHIAQPVVSNDGTRVVFATDASNFDPRHEGRTCKDDGVSYNCTAPHIYLKDLATGDVRLLTRPDDHRGGPSGTLYADISSDGDTVLIATQNAIDPDADTDGGQSDIYAHDVSDNAYTLVSATPPGLDPAAQAAHFPYMSADATRVVFQGNGVWDLPAPAGHTQAYMKDLTTGDLVQISTATDGEPADGLSQQPRISGDGEFIAFSSSATNLDPADTDGIADIYVREVATGSVELVSINDAGVKGNGYSFFSFPVQGSSVMFTTQSSNLDPADTDENDDIYRKLLAVPNADANGDGIVDSLQPAGTPAGSFVDSSLTPATNGSIVNAGGLAVTITDAPDAVDGVQITVGPGTGRASFLVCGGFPLRVNAGSTVVITCGSVRVRSVEGSADVVLGDGMTVVTIPQGAVAKVSEAQGGTYSVANEGTTAVTLTVDGVTRTLAGGETAPLATWDFVGFAQPVDPQPTLNEVKAGKAIPLKWRVLDSQQRPVTNLAAAKVSVASLTCSSRARADRLEETAAGASGLQNLGDGYYQLNWKSPTSYANSCKTVRLDIGDGVTHDANFRFLK